MTKTPTLPPPPPLPPRLSWVPSMDGLRGLAVLAVVAFHAGHLRGGYLGVDLFFTVSGFLITRLILDDLGRDRFSLTDFWFRRARRLLPALWVLLAVVILVAPWFVDRASSIGLRRSVVATAIYIANWWQLAGPSSYWEAFGSAVPLNHTWSLAIEEQFYVVWPLTAMIVWRLARRPVRALLAVAVVATMASILAQVLLFQPGTSGARAYLGTDTRAASILIGCATAIVLWASAHRAAPVVWHWLHLLAPLALCGIVIAWFVGTPSAWLYRGGLPALAIGAAVILASSAAPTPSLLNRALSWRPLVGVGQVSYGVYLWHWPVFTLLGAEQLHVHGWQLLVARLAITAALVALSYVLIERPYRFRWGPMPVRFFAASACVSGVLVAVLAWPSVPQVSAARADNALAALAAQQGLPPPAPGRPATTAAATASEPAARVTSTTTATTAAPQAQDPAGSTTAVATTVPAPTTAAPTSSPPVVFPAPRRLLVLGDSVAFTLRRGFRHQAPEGMRVTNDGAVACTPGPPEHPQLRLEDGAPLLDPCAEGRVRWPERVRELGADGVLMMFGSSGLARDIDGEWRRPCDPAYDASFQPSLEANIRSVQANGARVWITLAPYNRHASISADGRAQTDQQTDCLNRMYRDAAMAVGGVAVLDLRTLVCPTNSTCATDIDGIELRPDGLHFEGQGADLIARWMLLQLGPVR